MLPTAIFTALVAVVIAMPAYVARDDIPEIEMSLPAVNLDLLRYLSDHSEQLLCTNNSYPILEIELPLSKTFLQEADNNNDGFVSYDEGEDYAENVLKVKADKNWRQLFAEKDLDGDGRLDKEGEPDLQFMSLLSSWYRGDYDLKFNDYTVTSPDPREFVKKS
ncbi:hypothetical protein OSTOST_08629 [Ostertagia ostertagi]